MSSFICIHILQGLQIAAYSTKLHSPSLQHVTGHTTLLPPSYAQSCPIAFGSALLISLSFRKSHSVIETAYCSIQRHFSLCTRVFEHNGNLLGAAQLFRGNIAQKNYPLPHYRKHISQLSLFSDFCGSFK